MTRTMLVALTVLLSACSLTPPSGSEASASAPVAAAAPVRQVDVAALQADLDRGAVPQLIDVRTPAEFAEGHVPGAKNIPLDQLDARLSELGSAEAEVYVICRSGARSMRASDTLAERGLRPVNVRGGTLAWSSAGFAVER